MFRSLASLAFHSMTMWTIEDEASRDMPLNLASRNTLLPSPMLLVATKHPSRGICYDGDWFYVLVKRDTRGIEDCIVQQH